MALGSQLLILRSPYCTADNFTNLPLKSRSSRYISSKLSSAACLVRPAVSSSCSRKPYKVGQWPCRAGESDDFEVLEIEQLEDSNGLDYKQEDDEATDTGLDIIALEDLDYREERFSAMSEDHSRGGVAAGWTQLEEVDFLIDEAKFHRLELHDCIFYIKIAPDQDGDVYDFSEVYVAAKTSDGYAIPKIKGLLPSKPIRCQKSEWIIRCTEEPPLSTQPRQPVAVVRNQVNKVFLIKHHLNRRASHEEFVLNFDEIYVLDSTEKSIQRAHVQVEVSGGKNRKRVDETLIVRDAGTTFRVVPISERKTADQIINEHQWEKSRQELENHLKTYRDYDKSNWF